MLTQLQGSWWEMAQPGSGGAELKAPCPRRTVWPGCSCPFMSEWSQPSRQKLLVWRLCISLAVTQGWRPGDAGFLHLAHPGFSYHLTHPDRPWDSHSRMFMSSCLTRKLLFEGGSMKQPFRMSLGRSCNGMKTGWEQRACVQSVCAFCRVPARETLWSHLFRVSPLSPPHTVQPIGGAGTRARGIAGSEVTCMTMLHGDILGAGLFPRRAAGAEATMPWGGAAEVSSEMIPDLSPCQGTQDTSSWVPAHKVPGEHFCSSTAMPWLQGHGERDGQPLSISPHPCRSNFSVDVCCVRGRYSHQREQKPERIQPSSGLTTGDKDSHSATSEAYNYGQGCRRPKPAGPSRLIQPLLCSLRDVAPSQ